MLYEIGSKYYILAAGYYREVTIEKNGENYRVLPVENGEKISVDDKEYKEVDYVEAYKKEHKEKSKFSSKEK